jgi:ribonucleoside-diphosphate reductase alpha chain
MTTAAAALVFERTFSDASIDPYAQLKWEKRRAEIKDPDGKIVFEQDNIECPTDWSQSAMQVVASKYFYGKQGTPERETSIKMLITRVAKTIAKWGVELKYFDEEQGELFYAELTWLLINQYGSFNSPVWFNCGLYQQYGITGDSQGAYFYDLEKGTVKRAPNHYEYPQCSACFIQKVDDNMDSLMALALSEAMLFKYGSGTGTDLSTIRSFREELSGGGRPSGPMSFLGIYDKIAGIVKSGGKTRRAAKMNTLKDWHPDIMEFIKAKQVEEEKAHDLIAAGWDGSFNGEAYGTVAFQNENLSLRVSDKFMTAEANGDGWVTHWVTKPENAGPAYAARDVMKALSEATWTCGDPGMQYEDTIQRWHTCKNDGPINSSNPCSEYMFLDDTACNLASLNLMKFRQADGTFDHARFIMAVRIFITAQDIIVDKSSYPTQRIAKNSHLYRTLGLGYANLGAYLMSLGLPYDSDKGRAIAATITALMHMEAYSQSARIAAVKGPFERYVDNKEPMLEVVENHRLALSNWVNEALVPFDLAKAAHSVSAAAVALGIEHGYRNAQVTVLAPTGTIAFMMDCDTTGVEPDIALVKYKLLASTQKNTEGGVMKIVNQTVPMALKHMGYSPDAIQTIIRYIDQKDTIEGAPGFRPTDLAVFDCAFKPENGTRFIPFQAHLKMMAAVQPFLSGAISKTVNVPEHFTPADIAQVFRDGWKMGLKAVAIYRDNCKKSQPLSTKKRTETTQQQAAVPEGPREARVRLPNVRDSKTHKFEIGPHEGYLTIGFYPDGNLGELFVTMAKEGSTIRGLMDCWATAVSIGLQYGVPFGVYKEKFEHTRFDPSGWCNGGSPIKNCSSLPDYIFRWIDMFLNDRNSVQPKADAPAHGTHAAGLISAANSRYSADAPPCDRCGAITVRNGACFKCNNCGNSLGCS